ncbi:MAG: FhaA domain-containing protein [Blastocatellia bacterium]
MPEQNPKPFELTSRLEFFVRRMFERIGAAIDFALRRGSGLEGGASADLATLVAAIERAIEENLRREGSRVVAPNLIELRYNYETYTRMGVSRREFLQRELSASIYEYIYNRRYATLGETQVRIAYDAFTRGLEVRAGFGEAKSLVMPQNEPDRAIAAATSRSCQVVLRVAGNSRELRARLQSDGDPAGIGRNSANALVIDDPSVSNFHAALMLSADGNLSLADRGSSNGTCVNDVMIETGGKCLVRNSDRVKFGGVEATLLVAMIE